MDFNSLLGQIEASRPDLTDSLSLIRQFQKQKKDDSDNDDTDTDTDTDSARVSELEAILGKHRNINRKLLQKYQQLEDNYQSLIEHLDQLAEAVGACPQCWGEDVNCNYCKGRGKPGYFPPVQQYFDLYIKPVIIKLKNNNSKSVNN